VDLNYDELVPVKARDGWMQKTDKLWLPKHVLDADYILSVPKIKTHHWAGVTLSMKNLLGTIPGSRYGWPKNIIHMNGINATILGLFQTLPPVLAIMIIIEIDRNGPLFGTRRHGVIRQDAWLCGTSVPNYGFSLTFPISCCICWTGSIQAN
jgi:uncharacterized protein (DUF362 family)